MSMSHELSWCSCALLSLSSICSLDGVASAIVETRRRCCFEELMREGSTRSPIMPWYSQVCHAPSIMLLTTSSLNKAWFQAWPPHRS